MATNVLSIVLPGTGASMDPLKESVKLMVHGQEKKLNVKVKGVM